MIRHKKIPGMRKVLVITVICIFQEASYNEILKHINIKSIKIKKGYQLALPRLKVIFDAKPGSDEGDELYVIGSVVHKYETEKYPIDLPDPIDATKFRTDQLRYNRIT